MGFDETIKILPHCFLNPMLCGDNFMQSHQVFFKLF